MTTRLFSGLIPSVETGQWKPFGVPAVCRLLESLNASDVECDVVFFCRTGEESKNFKKVTKVSFPGFRLGVRVVPYYGRGIRNSRVRSVLNEWIHSAYLAGLILTKKYDLLYCDRIHMKFALIGSVFRVPTVIRFLGLGHFRSAFNSLSRTLRSPLSYLALKTRHSLVICTEDGSPSEEFFKTHLNRKTPVRIVLNGIDWQESDSSRMPSIRERHGFRDDAPLFLFVGRVSKDKGAAEFVQALIRVRELGKKFYAVLICGGSDFSTLKEEVDHHCLSDDVIFMASIPHDQIQNYYGQADVYVSLNTYGNLSNTVLEAMAQSKCIVMLDQNERDQTDRSTSRLVPRDIVIRIDTKNAVADLTSRLAELCDNPEKIGLYSQRMQAFAPNILWSWADRVAYEMEMLNRAARGKHVCRRDR